MTAQADPYVRVYYRIVEDPRFERVYGNDAALAAWLRLLLLADATYPVCAPLPATVKRAGLAVLVDAGIVELMDGGLYRMHGLAAERSRRSAIGREGAMRRWSERSAIAMPTHSERSAIDMHSEPNLSEPIRTEPTRAPARGNGAVQRTGRSEGPESIAAILARSNAVGSPKR